MDEQVAILEHHLNSNQLLPPSNLLDHIINNIKIMLLTQAQDTIEQQNASITTSFDCLEKLGQYKHDVIQQSVITGRKISDSLAKIVLDEKQKYCRSENDAKAQSEWWVAVINAMETRRLHMIERAEYMTKHKLASFFDGT
jgi:hypothetical protein